MRLAFQRSLTRRWREGGHKPLIGVRHVFYFCEVVWKPLSIPGLFDDLRKSCLDGLVISPILQMLAQISSPEEIGVLDSLGGTRTWVRTRSGTFCQLFYTRPLPHYCASPIKLQSSRITVSTKSHVIENQGYIIKKLCVFLNIIFL